LRVLPAEAIRLKNEAASLYKEGYIRGGMALEEQALVHLGNAMHTIQDATAPTHERFQEYKGATSVGDLVGKVIATAKHVNPERVYPDDPHVRGRLEAATRMSWDIYQEKRAVEDVFKKETGELLLPDDTVEQPKPESGRFGGSKNVEPTSQ
jgi:hypothetical protein